MNKRKFGLFLMGALIATSALQAQEDKMVVHPADGTANWESLIKDVKLITFSETGMNVKGMTAASTKTFTYESVGKITFSLTPSGITDLYNQVPNYFVFPSLATTQISLSGWNNQGMTNAAIYSTTGSLCRLIKNWNGASIDVSGLEPGLYILKVNNQSFKFRKL